MDVYEAIAELRRVSYKNFDLRFQAGPAGIVHVSYEFRADNSTPRWRDSRTWVIAEGSFNLMVHRAHDVEELHHMCLVALLANAETHEAREFYKVDGQAPFHPHTLDGEARWNRRTRAPVAA